MIDSLELLSKIKSIDTPNKGFNLVYIDDKYWGKTQNGDLVFAFDSINKSTIPMTQYTKRLKLYINTTFVVSMGGEIKEKKLSAIVLTDDDYSHSEVFVRLSLSLSKYVDERQLLKYFLELKDLFSGSGKKSYIELQGMYCELFVMYEMLMRYGIDVSSGYQSEDRRKFDFSITDKKKLEIKSTLKPERVHHFLQQQLDIDRFDIKVASFMLQKDDGGLSLFKLIESCKKAFCSNLALIIHIESMTRGCTKEELESIKFNYNYSVDNLRVYDAVDVPRIKEKNADGVFNVEYDVDLTNTHFSDLVDVADWIG